MTLRVLDLFSGIGGFSLGLERTGGFETVAFCEIEPFPRRVLAKHWPGIPIYEDVRTLTADTLRADGIAVDVICGGFPCQDISFAGKRAGLEGARSGLWGEYGRIIGEVRPRFVLIENVPGLLSLGMEAVLGDLSALGYDAIWDCVPASAVGAPHRRDRIWIIAYTERPERREIISSCDGLAGSISIPQRQEGSGGIGGRCEDAPHANGQGQHDGPVNAEMGSAPELVADARRGSIQPERDAGELRGETQEAEGEGRQRKRGGDTIGGCGQDVADASLEGLSASERVALLGAGRRDEGRATAERGGGLAESGLGGVVDGSAHWLDEPEIPRVAVGVPDRVARLKALGNGVVPQIPEMIGRAILAANVSRGTIEDET